MAEYVYPAIFHQNEDGSFTIVYPDLPGCISEGKSLGDAMYMAQSALNQWIEYLTEKKQSIPAASDFQSVEITQGEFINLIRADVRDNCIVKHDLKADYDFDMTNFTAPNIVMKDICDELKTVTRGFVVGNVCEYNGAIESYNMLEAMAALSTGLQGIVNVDIQDELGAIGDVSFKYELYLSADQFKNYKYRILFVGYDIAGYPVKVVVEQDIADELNQEEDSNYIYEVESKEKFEALLERIFKSKVVEEVVQDLIVATNRKKYANLAL